MTKLLDLAIAEVRKLSAVDQDETAEMLLWSIETRSGSLSLDGETIAAVDESLAQARRGEFASNAEIEALWKRRDDARPLYAASARRSDENRQLP
jgi:predicted transcriptional regulator